jgi:hypothetical protein
LKWPRHYAQDIAQRPQAEWKALILQCPEEWQELIRSHLKDYISRRAINAEQSRQNLQSEKAASGG